MHTASGLYSRSISLYSNWVFGVVYEPHARHLQQIIHHRGRLRRAQSGHFCPTRHFPILNPRDSSFTRGLITISYSENEIAPPGPHVRHTCRAKGGVKAPDERLTRRELHGNRQRSPDRADASRMPVVISVMVPNMLTRKTHNPVATAFPRPVFLMMKAISRSKAGARLTDRAKRGTLRSKTNAKQ